MVRALLTAGKLPLALLLLACVPPFIYAQPGPLASFSGKLTDLHSNPVSNATVVLRSSATGLQFTTVTAHGGAFHFSSLQPGEYSLRAASPALGLGSVQGILITSVPEVRIQVALSFVAQSSAAPIQLAHRPIDPQPLALFTSLDPESLSTLQMPPRPIAPAGSRLPLPVPISLPVAASVDAEPFITLPLAARDFMPAFAAAHLPSALNSVSSAKESSVAANPATSTAPPAVPVAANGPDHAPAAATTSTLTGEQLQTIPASGRRWENFVLDSPPTATQSDGDGDKSQRASSRNPDAVTVDGVNRSLAFNGRGARMRGKGSSLYEPGVSESAIDEVSTVSGNANIDVARAINGQLGVTTHGGANALHGQGFVFDRQNSWGAKNPFTQWVKETAPATSLTIPVFTPEPYTPADRELAWGLGVGGRIRRNKLFWFGAFDGFWRNDPGVATVRHPDLFFTQPADDYLQVLGARLGITGAAPLAAYSGMLETLAGLLGPAPRSATQGSGFGRLDWQLAERHRFTLEAIGTRWSAPGGALTRASETYGNHSFGSSFASESWLLGRWEAFLTPNLLAVSQGSFGRTIQAARPETPSAFEQQLLANNLWGQLPQIVADSRYGFTLGNPSRYGQGAYPDEKRSFAQQALDWVRGPLLLKTGFTLSHDADSISLLRNQTGTYHYANIGNFISDALVFQNYPSSPFDTNNQHGCDETGKIWHDSIGPRGLGTLPCYSYFTQTIGPSSWQLSTNDWALYAQSQWQLSPRIVLSGGLRWEREQLPPPVASIANSDLPLTSHFPSLGGGWGPRAGFALGSGRDRWPVLRLGYGIYFGRTDNAVIKTALSQTGSPKSDQDIFLRPTDNLPNNPGGAPPFPYAPTGPPGLVVRPGVVEFASSFRNPEIQQGVAAVEEHLPSHINLTATGMLSLGRHLPITIDTNIDPAVNPGAITYAVMDPSGLGPIKTSRITVPFYAAWTPQSGSTGRLNPAYQQITQIASRANSTYEAAEIRAVRYGRRGLSYHLRYTYAHAMDWNPNMSTSVAGSDVLDPGDFALEYGPSDWDIRHSARAIVLFDTPWKLQNPAGKLANGWMLSSVASFRSGMPYTMRTTGSLAAEYTSSGALIEALGPGMNGSGGDDRVYGVGRNTFRYPDTWKLDLRLGKRFDLGHARQLEFMAETYNLFNHQNVTELETIGYYIQRGSSQSDLPTLNFMDGLKAGTTAFGQPLNVNATNFYRERQLQLGLRMRF